MDVQNDKRLIKSEKKLIEDALKTLPQFRAWCVQFRKTYYIVNVKFRLPVLHGYANLTTEEQNQLDDLMLTLKLSYLVKVIGGGKK